MSSGDFYGNEQAALIEQAGTLRIELTDAGGKVTVLKEGIKVQAAELISATFMQCAQLREFYEAQIQDAKAQGLLLSLHLKATMMKISDPIMFGHAVSVYYKDVFAKHAAAVQPARRRSGQWHRRRLRQDPARCRRQQKAQVEADLAATYQSRPPLAMVDSDKGITNLHVPSDVIIDASMPAAIRTSGRMWGPDGKAHDMKAMIPDRCYAGVYQAVIEDCRTHGAYDVATMGNVSNVGLMAQAAEEYGSHDKTFKIAADGVVRVIDAQGTGADASTRWPRATSGACARPRTCRSATGSSSAWTAPAPPASRRSSGWMSSAPTTGWLIEKVKTLPEGPRHQRPGYPHPRRRWPRSRRPCSGCAPVQDTISVTGNVLRDYLTDLFPILELGTSAKMLSIVPLLAGGGMYETGAGGSAPKHVQQFLEEGHLRWDSLGEFLALQVSIEDLAAQDRQSRPHAAWPRRWMPPTASSWTTTSRHSARPASSTIAAATSTWRCTGRRRWRRRPRMPGCAPSSRRVAAELRARRHGSSAS